MSTLTNNTKQTPSATNSNRRYNVFDLATFDYSSFDGQKVSNNTKQTTALTNNSKN